MITSLYGNPPGILSRTGFTRTAAIFTTNEALTPELIDSEVTISVEEEGRVATLLPKMQKTCQVEAGH